MILLLIVASVLTSCGSESGENNSEATAGNCWSSINEKKADYISHSSMNVWHLFVQRFVLVVDWSIRRYKPRCLVL
jgi:hypothetical protein